MGNNVYFDFSFLLVIGESGRLARSFCEQRQNKHYKYNVFLGGKAHTQQIMRIAKPTYVKENTVFIKIGKKIIVENFRIFLFAFALVCVAFIL